VTDQKVPDNRFDSHQIEPTDSPGHDVDAHYFRVELPGGDDGLVWYSDTTAKTGTGEKGPEWIADKLNRRVMMRDYETTVQELRLEGGLALPPDPE
jgi:hypothetical protein